jgi:hypothetical protein
MRTSTGMIRFVGADPYRDSVAPSYPSRMVRRSFLGLLGTTSIMLVSGATRSVRAPPLDGPGRPPIEAPSSSDISLDPSRDFSETHTWVAGGSPVNLSGCSGLMVIRKTPSNPCPVLALSTAPSAAGILVLGGTAGTIHVHMRRAALAALVGSPGASYVLSLDFPNGMRGNLLEGRVHIGPNGSC